MCLLIFMRISAVTLRGWQTKSCNFTEILKAQKLKFSRLPSSNKIFYYFAPLGFGIAEYNNWPIVEIKIGKGWGVSRKKHANPGKLSPLSRICLKKLWHVCHHLPPPPPKTPRVANFLLLRTNGSLRATGFNPYWPSVIGEGKDLSAFPVVNILMYRYV